VVQGEGRAYSRWPERAPAILDSMLPVKNIFQKDGSLHLRQQVPERAKRAEGKSSDKNFTETLSVYAFENR